MKIDPRHLELLAAIVAEGGLSEGAERIGRSQPSASRTLSELEKRLGQPLFEPGRRPLQPTELGAMLAKHGAEILAAGQAASRIFDDYRQGRTGVVRIGGPSFFMDGVLSQILADFQQRDPALRIDQSYAYAEELFRRLDNGSVDLAVCPIKVDAAPAHLTSERLLRGRNVIAARTGHPLLAKRQPTLDDLSSASWIAPPAGSPLASDLDAALAELGVAEPNIVFTGGSLSSVLNFMIGSDALTLLPFSVVFAQRAQYPIQAARIRVRHVERDLCVVERKGAASTPAGRRLKRHLTRTFATLSQTLAHYETKSLWRN